MRASFVGQPTHVWHLSVVVTARDERGEQVLTTATLRFSH